MNAPKIESYRFGKIEIAGESYQKDLIITPTGVLPNWWREQGHSLSLADLQAALGHDPKVLIIGTGTFGRMRVSTETLQELQTAGIEVVIEKTEQACQIYNNRCNEGNVIAALHLTC